MSRKLLSLIVAVVFVFTSLSTAFAAAVPADVAGTDYVKAVGKMQGLGIMVGDANGNFRPNDVIKRSEFAKIAVIALGMADAAAISAGATQFSDVPADHWASGYINVASGAGIIKGYAGKFNPDDTITYAQAVTIIARMLGYGPVLDSKPWPQAYVAKAAEIGVTDGVVMAPTIGAKRGDVAKLVNNALTIEPLIANSYDANTMNPIYGLSTKTSDTILEKNLKCTLVQDDKTVTATPAWENNIDPKITINGTKYDFASSINADDYIGLNVKAWQATSGTNKDKIVALEITTDSANIYDGKVENDDSKFKLVGLSKSVDNATTSGGVCISVLNGSTAVTNIPTLIDGYTAVGRVVLDSGKAARAFLNFAGDINGGDNGVVKAISDGFLKFQGGTINDLKIQDIKDNAAKKTTRYDVYKDGKVATIDDVKVGDVVNKITFGTNYNKYIVTSGTDVGGVVSSITNSAKADASLTIGSNSYTLGSFTEVSTNNGDDYYAVNDPVTTQFKGFVGKTIKAYLNDAGEVALITATSDTTTYYYGLINKVMNGVATATGLVNYVEIYKADGTKVDYMLDNTGDYIDGTHIANADATTAGAATVWAQGDVVQYQLTSDGKISKQSLYAAASIHKDLGFNFTVDSFDYQPTDSPNRVVATGASYLVTTSSTIMNSAPLATNGDANVLTFDTIKNANNIGTLRVLADDTGVVKFVGVNSSLATASTNGVVTAIGIDADGDTATINVAGTLKTYKVTGGLTNLKKAQYSTYTVGSDGKISAAVLGSTFNALTTSGNVVRITGISGNYVKVKRVDSNKMETGTEYTLYFDAPDIYNVVDKDNVKGGLGMSELAQYDYIWVDSMTSSTSVKKVVKMKVDDITWVAP